MPAILLCPPAGTRFGVGVVGLDRENHRRAVEARCRHQQAEADLLGNGIVIEQLREEARSASVAPDPVMAGYDEFRRGEVTRDRMRRQLGISA